jgi:hypothetical protein
VLRRIREFGHRAAESAPASTPSQIRKSQAIDWLEIIFVSDTGEPMANETYEVRLPDGSTQQGVLDENGMAYLNGIVPGRRTAPLGRASAISSMRNYVKRAYV